MTNFNTTADLISYIGIERAAAALGVPVATIIRYRYRDKLPALWLDALEDAARRPLPRNLFTFKRTDA